jgi:hypothetical protein
LVHHVTSRLWKVKPYPGCHPDWDFWQFYWVTAVELLVNIWKCDKMASSYIISRNWRCKTSATDIVVTGATGNGWITCLANSESMKFFNMQFSPLFIYFLRLTYSSLNQELIVHLYSQRHSFLRAPPHNETCENREPWQTRGGRDVTRWRRPRGCFSLAASFSRSTAPSDKVSKGSWSQQKFVFLNLVNF